MTTQPSNADLLAAIEALGRRLDRLEAADGSAQAEDGGRVTLGFLAEQQRRLIEDNTRTREDMAVLLAMMQRLDGTVQGLVAETRAQHARLERALRRVDRLETAVQ
jgi:hypothetical protein